MWIKEYVIMVDDGWSNAHWDTVLRRMCFERLDVQNKKLVLNIYNENIRFKHIGFVEV